MVCEQHNGRMGIFGVRAKREGFPVKKFIQDHCLEPVAGTFVEAQIDWNEYLLSQDFTLTILYNNL